jgi:hypothetical protein
MNRSPLRGPGRLSILALLAATLAPAAVSAQERVYHPLYLPASHNWTFRAEFPAADRLFNGFDYGHGILYETLWTRPDAPVSLLEEDVFRRLTDEVLRNPPRLPMPEASFMPRYARLVPVAKEMFEWAHVLHRQTYDILADRRLSEAERDRAMADLLEHYLASDLAFARHPKGMEIMDEQYFSKAFRERHPRFNGLIWAYHWLQVAVYEPLLAYDDLASRQAAMQAALARFWQMVEGAPGTLPSEMPMTPAVAPAFTERYPEFAVIFDNLHMMHDVISDVLTSEAVARGAKRDEIYRQADLFRDPSSMAVSRDAWVAMAVGHGIDAQGGAAIGWLPAAPTLQAEGGHDMHAGHDMAAEPDTTRGAPAAVFEGEIIVVVRGFHEALARGDSVRALEALHADVRIHEGGRAENLDEYRAHHLAADMRFAAAVPREVLREAVTRLGEGSALYRAETRSLGRLGDREIDARGVETIVLVQTGEGWRIHHVHWSSR